MQSERPKLYGVLAVLSAIGLMCTATPPWVDSQDYGVWLHLHIILHFYKVGWGERGGGGGAFVTFCLLPSTTEPFQKEVRRKISVARSELHLEASFL